jgi:hypothetical protein
MNNIPQYNENEKQIMRSIMNFIKNFKVISALKKANCYKESGIPVLNVFSYLLQLVYTKKSMSKRHPSSRLCKGCRVQVS